MHLIDPEINNFYSQSSEESRLTTGLGPLEFERNKELISRYLPSHKCTVADIGGGPGHYAAWLAALGHRVLLVDPVNKHIQQAEKRSGKSKFSFQCIKGEARALPLDDHCADVVVLHGPLYHLQELPERVAALKEARRILRIGGIVLGFAITHAASTLAAFQNGMIYEEEIFSMCRETLLSGIHYPPSVYPGMLAPAFFYRPSALLDEFKMAGFTPIEILAVEGMVWLDKKYFENWSAPHKKQRMLELLKETEADPELLGLSPHIMLAAGLDYLK